MLIYRRTAQLPTIRPLLPACRVGSQPGCRPPEVKGWGKNYAIISAATRLTFPLVLICRGKGYE